MAKNESIQLLRVLAATGVVLFHSKLEILGVHTQFSGVALFFVISGYLMCKINSGNALKFIKDRFWRIVPNYWLATFFMLVLLQMMTWWPFEHVWLSLLFVPHTSPAGFYPVLGVGWTLNLEIYFYLIFALSIRISKKNAPLIAALIILIIKTLLPEISNNEALTFYYANSDILYFSLGILVWYIAEFVAKRVTLPRLNEVFVISLVAYIAFNLNILNQDSLIYFGVNLVVPLLVLSAVVFGSSAKYPALLMLMAEVSYSCYLLHTVLMAYLNAKGIEMLGDFKLSIIILIASWIVSGMWYFSVEKLVLLLKRKYERA